MVAVWEGAEGIAFKLAQAKLPVRSEFITTATPPRLGNIVSHDLPTPAGNLPIPALLKEMEANRAMKVITKIRKRNLIRQREIARERAGLVVRAPPLVLRGVTTMRLKEASAEQLDQPSPKRLEETTA